MRIDCVGSPHSELSSRFQYVDTIFGPRWTMTQRQSELQTLLDEKNHQIHNSPFDIFDSSDLGDGNLLMKLSRFRIQVHEMKNNENSIRINSIQKPERKTEHLNLQQRLNYARGFALLNWLVKCVWMMLQVLCYHSVLSGWIPCANAGNFSIFGENMKSIRD